MEYDSILEKLGLSDHEAKIYVAGLGMGRALPKHLAEKAGVKRPTLYKIMGDLLAKGLFSETIIGKRRFLVAEDPKKYIEKKQSELDQMLEIVPELRLLLATASIKPKISFYEGLEGLKKLYMENLQTKGEILEFVSLENIHPEIEFHSSRYFIPQRINKRIPIKIIVSGGMQLGKIILKTDPYALREVRTIDQKLYPIPLDLYIYDDNVAFALYRTDSEPIGVIIRSREVASTMRSLHSFIWKSVDS